MLAAGTLAVVMVVAMVVALTPQPGTGPEAISATTKPMLPDPIVAPPTADGTAIIAAVRAPRLASFTPIPNAVAAVPADAQRELVLARSLPADSDVVHVTTELVTYRVQWGDLAYVELRERALVFNRRGELVARMVGGEIELAVD